MIRINARIVALIVTFPFANSIYIYARGFTVTSMMHFVLLTANSRVDKYNYIYTAVVLSVNGKKLPADGLVQIIDFK